MGTMERYERFKAGEDVGKLMDEAEAFEAARNVNPKTKVSRPPKKKKSKEKAEEPVDES
jgi:hypothetical protein